VRPLEKRDVDVVCVYCPDTKACYYVDPKTFARSVTLRVTPTRNRQERYILQADTFRHVPDSSCRDR
jgi:hypothetical protein